MKSTSGDDREFENLLAAFSERELTSWEHDRLWTLLKESPERVERWKRECRLVGLLESLDESALVSHDVAIPPRNVTSMPGTRPELSSRRSSVFLWSAAAAVVLFGASLLLFPETQEAEVEGAVASVAESVPTAPPLVPEEPQEKYDRIVATLPAVGSQERPPTAIENASFDPNLVVDFNNDIRPILADKCFHCHGPDEHSRKADLRLDTEEGAFADLGGYFAIKKGDAEASEAVVRIFEDDPDSLMPPPEFHKPLSKDEKAKIIAWIEGGAEWSDHWSFDPPVLAAVEVSSEWGNNEIDAFVLAGMKKKGLTPNPEADRYALARRAALDLIGLPPTPEQLEAFLNDESDTAYETYVDGLLASVHYGEHRARFWLDAARFADTHGMHLDNYREMWPYRDWVINAFNENMPFDQFTIEQIAGDLLENPTKEQLIASGFNRNNITTSEGGSIPAELASRYMIDRTEAVSTIYLGLTTSCAACHDHKYDPVSQKEFYSLAAFFNNTADPAMDGNMRDHYPTVVVPKDEHHAEWYALEEKRHELDDKIRERIATQDEVIASWWEGADAAELKVTHPVSKESLALYLPMDSIRGGQLNAVVSGEKIKVPVGKAVAAKDHPAGNRGVRFPERGGFSLPFENPFQIDSEVTLSYWVRTPDSVHNQDLIALLNAADKEKKTPAIGWRVSGQHRGGFQFIIEDGHGSPGLSGLMPAETPLKPRSWQHVVVRYGGGQALSSITFYVGGERRFERRNTDRLAPKARFADGVPTELFLGKNALSGGLSDLRIFSRALRPSEIELLANEFVIRDLVEERPAFSTLKGEQLELVKKLYHYRFDEDTVKLNSELAATQQRFDFLYARNPTTQVMQERQGEAMANVLIRGEYDNLGEAVPAATPAVLPPLQVDGPADRLDLAKWLMTPDHPMTARVTVNRLWQSLFGTGIVKTAGDFGIMGEKPTHPELLDYLAIQFRDSGWDVKALLRMIVTSATYRQSSERSENMLAMDPENRFLSTGARRRLDAEVIRDQALAVSGILDRSVGGESVKPYQPPGVWKPVAFAGSNTAEFKQDPLEKIHRRSVYTFWKRTAVHPAFAAFDAPTREECSVKRERTNTPLQALVLMNDVQHVEAARILAEKIIRERKDQSDKALMETAFLRVVGHPSESGDLTDLAALLEMARNQYQSQEAEAKKLAATGDLPHDESLDAVEVSSWTLLINALMNRDDVINQS